MTYQNALKELENAIATGGTLSNAAEVLKVFKENTPIKAHIEYETEEIGDRDAFGGTGYEKYSYPICSNCENEIDNTEYEYCPWCGAKL